MTVPPQGGGDCKGGGLQGGYKVHDSISSIKCPHLVYRPMAGAGVGQSRLGPERTPRPEAVGTPGEAGGKLLCVWGGGGGGVAQGLGGGAGLFPTTNLPQRKSER